MKNFNIIRYKENGIILHQTNQPIYAWSESQNIVRVYVPLASDHVFMAKFGKYTQLPNGETHIIKPERLYMSPKGVKYIDSIPYNTYEQLVPTTVLSGQFDDNNSELGFQLEAYRIEDDKYLGIKKFGTDDNHEIISALINEYPTPNEGDFVRVIDTGSDWVYDGDEWGNTEAIQVAGMLKRMHDVATFSIEGSFDNAAPSHKPENTTYILSELEKRALSTEVDGLEGMIESKLNRTGTNAPSDIKLRDVTFNKGLDTDVVQKHQFSYYNGVGEFIARVETGFDETLDITALQDYYDETQIDTMMNNKAPVGHTHIEEEILGIDKYSQEDADNRFMIEDTYVDSKGMLKYDKIPDSAKERTIVVETEQSLDEIDDGLLFEGTKSFVLATGRGYIWNGEEWLIVSDPAWAAVDLEWDNVNDRPTNSAGNTLRNSSVYDVNEANVTFAGVNHTHNESDISDLDKYSQDETDALLDDKEFVSNIGSRTYTQQNFVTNGQTVTQSLNSIDLGLNSHQNKTDNPHEVTQTQVGLSNVDNTSDLDKPLSNAVITELNKKLEDADLDPYIKSDTLLDETGKIDDIYIKESYNDAYTGYGVFDTTDPEDIILLDLYPPNQWDTVDNEPLTGAEPYEKRANVVYVTKNVTENALYRYSEVASQFTKLMPSVIGLGVSEGTAYEGSAGQENRDRLIVIENDYLTASDLDTIQIDNINDITNVEIVDPISREVLMWNATENRWENKKINSEDVDLGNVQNYDIASQVEAETGTVNDKYMTPLRTKQSIVENAPEPDLTEYDTHIEDTNNPHNVSKSDVGLENVDNTADANKYVKGVTETNSNVDKQFWQGTQAEYDGITPDNNVIYLIEEE